MTDIDLVAWDFGDTLVHERFMRIPPATCAGWGEIYDRFFVEHPGFEDRWMLGQATMNELIPWLSSESGLSPAEVARHLRAVWHQIVWFESSRRWIEDLNGRTRQAVVTVNPFEFSGISTACGLDPLVDVIVTSADLGRLEKSVMAAEARRLLGLPDGLATTLLIDNKADNVEEFAAAGGQAVLFDPAASERLDEALSGFGL